MSHPRSRHLSALALLFGLAALAAGPELLAAGKGDEAKKYAADLKTSKDVKVRAKALNELGELGQVMKAYVEPVVPEMIAALDDKDAGVRAAAARAIGKIDPDPAATVPALLKLTKEEQPEEVRVAAIQGLAAMGPAAKGAMKDLRKIEAAYPDKKGKLYRAAMDARRSINPKN